MQMDIIAISTFCSSIQVIRLLIFIFPTHPKAQTFEQLCFPISSLALTTATFYFRSEKQRAIWDALVWGALLLVVSDFLFLLCTLQSRTGSGIIWYSARFAYRIILPVGTLIYVLPKTRSLSPVVSSPEDSSHIEAYYKDTSHDTLSIKFILERVLTLQAIIVESAQGSPSYTTSL